MATQTITVANFHAKAGTNTTNPATVPSGFVTYTIGMDVSAWAGNQRITLQTQFAADGGAWVNGAAIDVFGGSYTDKFGNPELPSCTANLPPFVTTLQARIILTVPVAGNTNGTIVLST
jgi:hypothetical protein